MRTPPDPGADAGAPDDTTTSPATDVCSIDADFLSTRNACSTDADCEVVPYRTGCCTNMQLTAVSRDAADEVRECASEAPPPCTCAARPTRADDGRASSQTDFSDVVAQCVGGTCKTAIGPRPCGSALTCKQDEICVAYDVVAGQASPPPSDGGNAGYTLACVPNPCQDAFDCSCAQSVCDSHDAAPRQCEIKLSFDFDVFCAGFRT